MTTPSDDQPSDDQPSDEQLPNDQLDQRDPDRHRNDRHLNLDQIADLQEGLLDGHSGTLARAHLGACEQCRTGAAALLDVRERLSAVTTGPMPVDVASRLDEALLDQARAAAAAGPTASATADLKAGPTADDHGTVLPLQRRLPTHKRWSATRLLQAAAAVVLLLVGVALAVSVLSPSGGDTNTSTAAKQTRASEGAATDEAGRYAVLSSGTDYTPKTLAAAVPRLLSAQVPTPASGAQPDGPPPSAASRRSADAAPLAPQGPANRLAGGPALAGCLVELTGATGTKPLAVDVATFEGKPATVILLPTPGDPASVDVSVVGPGCRPGDAALLNFTRVALP